MEQEQPQHVEQQGAEAPEAKETQPTSMAGKRKPKPLSGVLIKAYFDGTEAQKISAKVATIEGSQINHLFGMFGVSDFQTVKTALKDYKDLCKGADGKVPKVARNRVYEVQSLFGAFRFAGLLKPTAGYHATVATARALLAERKLKWDGGRIPEKWEKEVAKEVREEAEVELAARMEIKAKEMKGEEISEEQHEEIRLAAQEQQQKSSMVQLAQALVKKYGTEKCGWLVDALEAHISVVEQMAKDAMAEKKAA